MPNSVKTGKRRTSSSFFFFPFTVVAAASAVPLIKHQRFIATVKRDFAAAAAAANASIWQRVDTVDQSKL